MSPLDFLILLPILAAVSLWALPKSGIVIARFLSVATLALAIALWVLFPAVPGGDYAFEHVRPMVPQWGLNLSFGVDALGLAMVTLSTLVLTVALWSDSTKDQRSLAAASLIAAGAIGAFISTNLFFLYAFHELALIPTLIAVLMSGHGDKVRAAWKATLYLGGGSLVLLAGLISLVMLYPTPQGITFDLKELLEIALASNVGVKEQLVPFSLLFLGFGILVSLFPFHSWAIPLYAQAPAPVAMLHAGVLKKFGLFGLLRVALPLLPLASSHACTQQLICWLLLGNVIWMGWVTIGQSRLENLVASSSVSHMGIAFLGIAAATPLAGQGVALLMIGHGLSVALLLALANHLRKSLGHTSFAELGGIASTHPRWALLFALASFASLGLPAFANFAGEILIFMGAIQLWTPGTKAGPIPITAMIAMIGVVISAVYSLRALKNVCFGASRETLSWSDLNSRETLALSLLVIVLLTIGLQPGWLVNAFSPWFELLLK